MDWLDSEDSDLELAFMAAVIEPQRRRRKPTQREVLLTDSKKKIVQ